MYNKFCNSFRCYLTQHSSDLCHDENLLEMLNPFYGLSDFGTYENWKLRSDMRYYETSNLIYALKKHIPMNPLFEQLYEEFCHNGYDAHASEEFNAGIVTNQLKLISYLLEPSELQQSLCK